MNFCQLPQLMGFYQMPMQTPMQTGSFLPMGQPLNQQMGMQMPQGMTPNMMQGVTPSMMQGLMQGMGMPQQGGVQEESYIENILRLNLGKPVSVYMNFENSQWGSKIFKGTLEAAGKDHIIIADPNTNMRYLLLSIYLNYVTFDEEINYYYPQHPSQGQQTSR